MSSSLVPNNPSVFDAVGTFDTHFNQTGINSLAIPLDVGKAVPPAQRKDFINEFQPSKPVKKQGSGFWYNVGEILNKAYNFSSHMAAFGITKDNSGSAISGMKFANPANIAKHWDETKNISAGQAAFQKIAGVAAIPAELTSMVGNLVNKDNPKTVEDVINNHFLAGSANFNIFDEQQRRKAFEEQTFGKVGSWTSDFVARFTIDPTIFVGKAYKGYKALNYTLAKGADLKTILASKKAGEALSFREKKIAGTFEKFLSQSDGMVEADFFRIKAVRESSNPAVLADLLATANRLHPTNTIARHNAKTDVIHMAMGDADAFTRLEKNSRLLAAKVGALNMEVQGAKYLGAGKDSLGNPVFSAMNEGDVLEKTVELITEHQAKLDTLYKKMASEATLNPGKIPYMDNFGKIRTKVSGSQAMMDAKAKTWQIPFTDLNVGLAGAVVRFQSGFFYKRPKNWIDFADNQSVQTVDNLLSRVIGISSKRATRYTTAIAAAEKEASKNSEILKSLKNQLAEQIKITEKNPSYSRKDYPWFKEQVDKKIKSIENKIGETSSKLKNYTTESKKLQENFKLAHFSVERKNELFARYTSAIGVDQRALVYQDIEKELFSTVANQFGYTVDQVGEAYRMFSGARTKAHNLIKERSYSGGVDTATGKKIGAKIVVDEEGMTHVFPLPLNESQLVREIATLDIDTLYKVLRRKARVDIFDDSPEIVQSAIKATINGKVRLTDMADGIDQMLKFQVLARLGYPVRNVTEGSMRIMTTVGPLALAHAAAAGMQNSVMSGLAKMGVKDVFNWAEKHNLETERLILQATRDVSDNPELIDNMIQELTDIIDGKIKPTAQYGMGTINILGYTFEDAKGATPEMAKFINEKFVNNASQVFETIITNSKTKLSNALQNTGDFVDIAGNDPTWVENYIRVINRQVRNSKLTSQILEGKSFDEIVKWMNVTPEGQRVARSIGLARGGESVNEIVRMNFQNIAHLFPEGIDPGLMKIASERNITVSDIKNFFGTETYLRPTINGAQISIQNGTHPAIGLYTNMLERFYNTFGSIPENRLTKSPLYVEHYRNRLAASVERAIQTTKGDTISPLYMKKMESEARQWARAEMRRELYDLSEKTDAAHSLRFIYPFFGAYSDVMEKWGKIIIDDPSVLAKLNTIYTSPDRNGMTEERNGLTYVNIPSSWAKAMSLGYTDQLSIPKASLNLIFQGGAWWNPGAGWFVQAAASKLLTEYPQLETTRFMTEILPYGVQDRSVQDILLQSSAGRKAFSFLSTSDPARQQLTATILAEEMTRYQQGERTTEPTKKEINDRARGVLGMKIAASLTLPFALNVKSPYQMYIDEYHRMRSEDALKADEKFYNLYGDALYNFTISLSKNNTGINATLTAEEATKKYSDLIAKNPEFGWFIIGDANSGDFSPTVYGNQQTRSVAPGSTTKFREKQDAYSAMAKVEANRGWIQYRKGSAIIESIRIRGGFDSLNSSGAEWLRSKKQELITALGEENPDWAKSYSTIDTGKVLSFLRYADEIATDPRLAGRPDIQTLNNYVKGRETIISILKTRNSPSLTDPTNSDLNAKWQQLIGILLKQDITFGDVYSRILEKDDLSKGL